MLLNIIYTIISQYATNFIKKIKKNKKLYTKIPL